MLQLLSHLRFMNLFYHHAHNVVSRVPFFADHEALGSFYTEADKDYDDVIERMIGKDMQAPLVQIMSGVQPKLSLMPQEGAENKQYFVVAMQLEKDLRSLIDQEIAKGVSEGTRQLLGNIADKSEMRTYKLKQRVK